MPRFPFRLLLLFLLCPLATLAAPVTEEEPTESISEPVEEAQAESASALAPSIHAVRTSGPLRMDGALGEEAWKAAPVFDAFIQSYPQEGAAPSERTELRVLHDDRFLYIGIQCLDSQPSLIQDNLGRRDELPASDLVRVVIDSRHDHRTAYRFSINAAGVLADGLYFEDTQQTDTWDAVWEGAAVKHDKGWSAELAIPLHLLRLSGGTEQSWGFGVRREIFRTHELIDSALVPRDANAFVSLLGHLEGLVLDREKSRSVVELTPYLATRLLAVPQYSDPSRPLPRLTHPTADVGLDLRATLGGSLDLVATVNPDFGQVEADELFVNYTPFEQFLPEKRPFFTQGIDLFQPVGSESGEGAQMLFYSRRIGLVTPILGAAKLTGTLGEHWRFGVLDAVVAGPGNPARDEDMPDTRFGFHPARPFHLGPNSELPAYEAVTRNFLAAVARGRVLEGLTLGASATASTPLSEPCAPVAPALEEDLEEADCLAPWGGHAVGLDWDWRSPDKEWVLLGQLAGSQVVGGPGEGSLLRDGTRLRSGDVGGGLYVKGGKLGGEPWRFTLAYEYTSPQLELNRTGFQRTQNEQLARGRLGLVLLSGLGPLLELSSTLGVTGRWSTEGRSTSRGDTLSWETDAVLPGFHTVGFAATHAFNLFELGEIPEEGIAFERPDSTQVEVWGSTDINLPLAVSATAYAGGTYARGPAPSQPYGGGSLAVTWRPQPRLETQLIADARWEASGPRFGAFGESPDAGHFFFGDLSSGSATLTLRQLWVMAANLTLQGYFQVLGVQGSYTRLYEGVPTEGTLRLEDLSPLKDEPAQPFQCAALNLSLVFRWEYRPGSTLFLVYSRAQQSAPRCEDVPPPLFQRQLDLRQGPTRDQLLLKWTSWWDL